MGIFCSTDRVMIARNRLYLPEKRIRRFVFFVENELVGRCL